MSSELSPALAGSAGGELAAIEGGASPHVPHEDGEEEHHEPGAYGAAELELARVVDLGVLAWLPAVHHVAFRGNSVCVNRILSVRRAVGVTVAMSIGMTIGVTVGMAVGITIRVTVCMAVGMTVRVTVGSAIDGLDVVLVQVLDELGGATAGDALARGGGLSRFFEVCGFGGL